MTAFRVMMAAASACLVAGCATVSIVDAAQSAMTEAQASFRGAANNFADFLYARGWCADPAETMTGVLLNGRAADEDPALTYLQSKHADTKPALAVAQAVGQDATEAAREAGIVNRAAALALSDQQAFNPIGAAEDLRAIERAVISAKRARQLFAAAADRLRARLDDRDEHTLDAPIGKLDGEIAKMAGYADQLALRSRAVAVASLGR